MKVIDPLLLSTLEASTPTGASALVDVNEATPLNALRAMSPIESVNLLVEGDSTKASTFFTPANVEFVELLKSKVDATVSGPLKVIVSVPSPPSRISVEPNPDEATPAASFETVNANESLPAPPETLSVPEDTLMTSSPSPPSTVSLPVPPVMVSLPAPPTMESGPPLPVIESSPAPPESASPRVVDERPFSVSLPDPPEIVVLAVDVLVFVIEIAAVIALASTVLSLSPVGIPNDNADDPVTVMADMVALLTPAFCVTVSEFKPVVAAAPVDAIESVSTPSTTKEVTETLLGVADEVCSVTASESAVAAKVLASFTPKVTTAALFDKRSVEPAGALVTVLETPVPRRTSKAVRPAMRSALKEPPLSTILAASNPVILSPDTRSAA